MKEELRYTCSFRHLRMFNCAHAIVEQERLLYMIETVGLKMCFSFGLHTSFSSMLEPHPEKKGKKRVNKTFCFSFNVLY